MQAAWAIQCSLMAGVLVLEVVAVGADEVDDDGSVDHGECSLVFCGPACAVDAVEHGMIPARVPFARRIDE